VAAAQLGHDEAARPEGKDGLAERGNLPETEGAAEHRRKSAAWRQHVTAEDIARGAR